MTEFDKEYLKLCKTILEEGKEVINKTIIFKESHNRNVMDMANGLK